MNKITLLLSAFCLSFAVSQPALAYSGDMKKCPCPMMKKAKQAYEKLNLTEEQKKQMKAMKEKYKDQMKANREAYKKLMSEKHALIKADKIDTAKMEELINQKKELVAAKMKMKIQMKHDLYHILTPAQQKQMDTMMHNMEQMQMKDRHEHDMDDDSDDSDD